MIDELMLQTAHQRIVLELPWVVSLRILSDHGQSFFGHIQLFSIYGKLALSWIIRQPSDPARAAVICRFDLCLAFRSCRCCLGSSLIADWIPKLSLHNIHGIPCVRNTSVCPTNLVSQGFDLVSRLVSSARWPVRPHLLGSVEWLLPTDRECI